MVRGESSGSGSDNNLDEVLDVQYSMGGRVLFMCTMSSFFRNFEETDAMFLEFDDAFNNKGGSFSLGDTSSYSHKWASTLSDSEKTSPVPKLGVRESAAKADVPPDDIEVVKGALQRYFVLDFNDSLTRFVENHAHIF
ncbi:cytochrome P450 CYP82D47-like [Cucumis melo var. makuwa]|uniref:Cytochrome P450 CYP82D47-like n=1 Tax=Cucumis melo var. makuwa TaxID=1194695 RepID=A0A5A7VMY5_CUCMM|nr:cytochrome P450 CYP82D47-like [Cucumis melo var. makuwa]